MNLKLLYIIECDTFYYTQQLIALNRGYFIKITDMFLFYIKHRLTIDYRMSNWENVGTSNEQPPLSLENCLSYDEMKISAMIYISGYTICINDGNRHNNGTVDESNVEREAVIIGMYRCF